MFHQSEVIPRAGLLWGSSAFCFEPQPAQTQPAQTKRSTSSGARFNASQHRRVSKPENGYPRPTRSNESHSRWRQAALGLGVAILVAAQLAPLSGRFSVHMAQHLLIGDVAPLLVVLGGLRLRVHPLVALPLWAASLCAWHLTPLYDAALDHTALHALQHAMFFVCGLLLWSGMLAPIALGWKFAYVGGMWIVSLALAQVFLWSGHAYYARYALDDQRVGGGVMLVEGSAVMLGVLVWLLLLAFREPEPASSR
jgi:putative membrane protein